MSKPHTRAWAILSGRIILPFTVRSTKRQCIHDFLKARPGLTWPKAVERGNSIARIRIEVE